ncbi:hypothetical protein Dimus_038940 [Dionaea muscipula]
MLKDILWKAARATTVACFGQAMEEMKEKNKDAFIWLSERDQVHWSRSHFDPFPKCGVLLNNLCESFNAAILPARDKSIVSMLEKIRLILMETTYKRRDTMKRYSEKSSICPKICKLIEKMKENTRLWILRYVGNNMFEVVGPYGGQYRVEMVNRYCSCRRWKLSEIPCVHAISCLNFLCKDPLGFVDECYSVSTYLRTYEKLILPINGKEDWPVVDKPLLHAPDVVSRPRRPKKARRRESDEPNPTKLGKKGVKMTYHGCGREGHNKRGCKHKSEWESFAAK